MLIRCQRNAWLRAKKPAIKGGFGKGKAEVGKEMESHITWEMIIKKEERKKVKEETKKVGRDRGKRREVT